MNILNVHNEALSEKYLCMPSDVGASVNGAFKYLKYRVWKKVQGWMEQALYRRYVQELIVGVYIDDLIITGPCVQEI